MGYYQGDYYAGAQGDPFWGSLVGLVRRGVGALLGGAAGGGARSAAGMAQSGLAAQSRAIIKRGAGAIIKHPVLSAAGAAGVVGAAMGAGGERMLGAAHPGMKGYHLCKSMRGKHPHPCKTGEFVRNRHMNPCNPRALRRAVRRAHAFTRLAMKTIHLVHPKKKARFGGFRKRAKR